MTIALPENYVELFLPLCTRLIKEVFDVECEIQFPFNLLETEMGTDKERLDVLILYLRRIHGYCFFTGIRYEGERALANKSSLQYLRAAQTVPEDQFNHGPSFAANRQFVETLTQNALNIL